LTLQSDITIQGPADGNLTINGQGTSRVFTVTSSHKVTLANMTLRNGSADQGGAISNAGQLSLWSMEFVNNQATGVHGVALGGAIYNGPGATLDVHNGVFLFNKTSAAMQSAGGAIAIDGAGTAARLDNSYLLFNQALGGLQSQGGAIANLNGASLTITSSLIADNTARGGANGDGLGGGVYNGASSTLNLEKDIIIGNLAQGGAGTSGKPGGQGLGGGVYLASGGKARQQKTRIALNSASTAAKDVFGSF
jgi:hypothetical protein